MHPRLTTTLSLILVLFLSLVATQNNCSRILAPDGGRYDLTWFQQSGKQGPLKGTTGGDTYRYFFTICGDGFPCGMSACTSNPLSGACQGWGDFTSPLVQACLGAQPVSNLVGLSEGKGVTFSHANGDTYKSVSRTTNFILNCNPSETGWGTVVVDDSKQLDLLFTIHITSEHACASKPPTLPPPPPSEITCGGNGWLYGKNCTCLVENGQYKCVYNPPNVLFDITLVVTNIFNANQICIAVEFIIGPPQVTCGAHESKVYISSNQWGNVANTVVFCGGGACVYDQSLPVIYYMHSIL